MKKVVRKKAFIGAAIGAVANIAGGLISGAKKRKAQEEQQAAQNVRDAIQRNQALAQQYNNQEYVDEYLKKQNLKMGGEFKYRNKINAAKSKVRCGTMKKYACGGKNKYACGGRKKGLFGLSEEVSGEIGAGISGVASGLSQAFQPVDKPIQKAMPANFGEAKTTLTKPDYLTNPNSTVNTVPVVNNPQKQLTYTQGAQYKCGGKKVTKRRKC